MFFVPHAVLAAASWVISMKPRRTWQRSRKHWRDQKRRVEPFRHGTELLIPHFAWIILQAEADILKRNLVDTQADHSYCTSVHDCFLWFASLQEELARLQRKHEAHV